MKGLSSSKEKSRCLVVLLGQARSDEGIEHDTGMVSARSGLSSGNGFHQYCFKFNLRNLITPDLSLRSLEQLCILTDHSGCWMEVVGGSSGRGRVVIVVAVEVVVAGSGCMGELRELGSRKLRSSTVMSLERIERVLTGLRRDTSIQLRKWRYSTKRQENQAKMTKLTRRWRTSTVA
ncbi:hypothetical protein Tco_0269320 [Tanacetum coccineum]